MVLELIASDVWYARDRDQSFDQDISNNIFDVVAAPGLLFEIVRDVNPRRMEYR